MQQYGGRSSSRAISFPRWSSPSLNRSQSVTTASVRSAIMGMASAVSARDSAVRSFPSRAWQLKVSEPGGISASRSCPR